MINFRLTAIALLLTLTAIALATFSAAAGQSHSRVTGMTEIHKGRYYWQFELAQAKLHDAPPEKIAKLQKIVDDHNARDLPSYRLPDRLFTQWDGYRYEEIVTSGYHFHQPSDPKDIQNASVTTHPASNQRRLKNVVWYPLYPLLGYLTKSLTSLPAHHALTLVSWLCILATAPLLCTLTRNYAHKLIIDNSQLLISNSSLQSSTQIGNRQLAIGNQAALAALTLLLFNPCAIFFYANFTESLFTLLLVAFLYCLQQKWFWRAALIAALASATRSQGVLFGPILALVYTLQPLLNAHPTNPPLPTNQKSKIENQKSPTQLAIGNWQLAIKRIPLAFALGTLSALGLLAYVTYLQLTFQSPFAFMAAQKNWNVGINAQTLAEAANPTRALGFFLWRLLHETPIDLPRLWETFCLLWPPVLILIYRKKLTLELTLIALMLWILPYISNSLAGNPPEDTKWMSMGRFTAVQIPLFIMLGITLAHSLISLFSPPPSLTASPRLRVAASLPLPFLLIPTSITLFALFAYKFGAGQWIG